MEKSEGQEMHRLEFSHSCEQDPASTGSSGKASVVS